MNAQKLIKKLSTILGNNKSSLYAIHSIQVRPSSVTITNVDTWVILNHSGDRSACIDCATYCKTGNFGLPETIAEADFPVTPAPTADIIQLPVGIFSESRENMLKFAAVDESRRVLKNFNLQPGYGWYCADGHCAIIDHNIPMIDRPLSIRPETVRTVAALLAAGGEVLESYISGCRGIDDEGAEYWGSEYLYVVTSIGTIISKIDLSDNVPEVSKIVPAMRNQFSVDVAADDLPVLISSLKTILPYANERTSLVKLQANRFFLENRDIGTAVELVLPFNARPETFQYPELTAADFVKDELAYWCRTDKPTAGGVLSCDTLEEVGERIKEYNSKHAVPNPFFPIGINCKYFIDLLSDIRADGPVRIGYRTAISAITLDPGNGIEYLIMPLRIMPLRILDEEESEPIESEPIEYKRLAVPERPAKKRGGTSTAAGKVKAARSVHAALLVILEQHEITAETRAALTGAVNEIEAAFLAK